MIGKRRFQKSFVLLFVVAFSALAIEVLIWDAQDRRWIIRDLYARPPVTEKLTVAPPIEQNATSDRLEIDDASKLNSTPISKLFQPTSVSEIRSILLQAQQAGQKISISGSRHSMGGQIMYPASWHLDMRKLDRIQYNRDRTVTVQSGATWKQIQMELGKHNRAVQVMQDSNIFTVGGSMSVNVHGKDARYGSLIDSVNSFKIITADGQELQCSRTQNQELFRAAIGGMGLFGAITEVNLNTTDNTTYNYSVVHQPRTQAIAFMEEQMKRSSLEMIEAQLSVDRDHFLIDSQVYYFDRADFNPELKDDVTGENSIWLRKLVYRTSRASNWGKQFRWFMQKNIGPSLDPPQLTRNSAMAAPFRTLELNRGETTDILQEYFVPTENVDEFFDRYIQLLKEHDLHLINVTIRKVNEDREALVSYATSDMYGFVAYYKVACDQSDSDRLSQFTQNMMDSLDRLNGTIYLAYRGYYTKAQIDRMYPQLAELFALKQKYDPTERFSNLWYEQLR
jgi:decaprenylphospho-beta-D-ribofuranose 2-oxidase